MIDQIIAEYLSANKRLVVPDFGAFIRKDQGEVVFMEFLKKDDQVLTNLICQKYNMSPVDARNAVAQYVAGIKTAVATGGSYPVSNLGHLVTDANGLFALTGMAVPRPQTTVTDAPSPQAVPNTSSAPPSAPAAELPHVPQAEPATEKIPHPAADTIPGRRTHDSVPGRPTTDSAARTARPAYTNAPAPQPARPGSRPQSQQAEAVTVPARPAAPRTITDQLYDSPAPQAKPHTQPAPAGSPVRQQGPVRPKPVNYAGRKKTDFVMIIAIIAAAIAIGSMVYGILVSNDPVLNIQPTNPIEEVYTPESVPGSEGAEAVPE